MVAAVAITVAVGAVAVGAAAAAITAAAVVAVAAMVAAMLAAITADRGPVAVRAVPAMRRVPVSTVLDTERWDTAAQPAMMGRLGMLAVLLGTLARAGMLHRAAVKPMGRASATG